MGSVENIKSASEANENNYVIPELRNWHARNPVLYLKQYFNSDGGLQADTIEKLAKEMKISEAEFNKLSDREIIIVRTPKFDVKS